MPSAKGDSARIELRCLRFCLLRLNRPRPSHQARGREQAPKRFRASHTPCSARAAGWLRRIDSRAGFFATGRQKLACGASAMPSDAWSKPSDAWLKAIDAHTELPTRAGRLDFGCDGQFCRAGGLQLGVGRPILGVDGHSLRVEGSLSASEGQLTTGSTSSIYPSVTSTRNVEPSRQPRATCDASEPSGTENWVVPVRRSNSRSSVRCSGPTSVASE